MSFKSDPNFSRDFSRCPNIFLRNSRTLRCCQCLRNIKPFIGFHSDRVNLRRSINYDITITREFVLAKEVFCLMDQFTALWTCEIAKRHSINIYRWSNVYFGKWWERTRDECLPGCGINPSNNSCQFIGIVIVWIVQVTIHDKKRPNTQSNFAHILRARLRTIFFTSVFRPGCLKRKKIAFKFSIMLFFFLVCFLFRTFKERTSAT